MFKSTETYAQLKQRQPFLWTSPGLVKSSEVLPGLQVHKEDIIDADNRLKRFAPLIKELFCETEKNAGLIESELLGAPRLTDHFRQKHHINLKNELLIKADHALPVAGSIKARGGIYEVLLFAEKLAIENGFLSLNDNYKKLLDQEIKRLFSKYTVSVGSTGNLGLSIGVTGAALGFSTEVHMSVEAKEWKKKRLRDRGVKVVEHSSDYTSAVNAGRKAAESNPFAYFIDDENSVPLFLGYSVAALRLHKQLEELNITINAKQPLFVYIPCGVGGAPGGINFGLKHTFGDHVHVFYAEPVSAPCMLLGLISDFDEKVSVYDLGFNIETDADGLAVGQASELVGKLIKNIVSGSFTIEDADLYRHLYYLYKLEQLKIEPSAAAGFNGPLHILKTAAGQQYVREQNLADNIDNARHLLWTTGGLYVPETEFDKFLDKGRTISNREF